MEDIEFSLVSEAETVSRWELKATFYRRNRFKRYDWDGTAMLVASKPLAFIRERGSLRVQYADGYYVLIEQGRAMLSGPHKAALYTTMEGVPNGLWLGTLQFDGMFFDDKSIRRQLRTAIKKREWWASPESDDERFEITEPVELVDLTDASSLPLSQGQARKQLIIKLKGIFPRSNIWGGTRWKIPKCPICKAVRPSEAKLSKHIRKVHHKTVVFHKPSHLMPPWR